MPCIPCLAQLHELCEHTTITDGFFICCCHNEKQNNASITSPVEEPSLGESLVTAFRRELKHGESMKDVLSTGRHRAAIAKPFEDGAICEWARLKYAGGGVKPIIGCAGNELSKSRGKYARHHGPDKNVLNNEESNLHLICPTCHNRWHALNDPYYGDGTGSSRPPAGQTWLPNVEWKKHDPSTKATAEDIVNNEIRWKTGEVEVNE